MIERIKSALKTEYKGLGLGDKTIDRLATYVQGLVENEDDIATAVKRDDVKLIATSIQGEIDGIRKAKQAAEEELEEYKKSHPDTKTDPPQDTKDDSVKELLDKYNALAARLDAQDKEAKRKAVISAAKKAAKEAGCTNEKALALTERLFSVKDDESNEDAAKRFEADYNSNVKEYFGDGITPFQGAYTNTLAKVSDADRAAKAREDAKRVREG